MYCVSHLFTVNECSFREVVSSRTFLSPVKTRRSMEDNTFQYFNPNSQLSLFMPSIFSFDFGCKCPFLAFSHPFVSCSLALAAKYMYIIFGHTFKMPDSFTSFGCKCLYIFHVIIKLPMNGLVFCFRVERCFYANDRYLGLLEISKLIAHDSMLLFFLQ